MTETVPSLVVADDHPVVLRGLVELLQMDFRIVAACSNGDAAITAVREHHPDVLVLDLSMPEGSGLDVLEAFRKQPVSTNVLLLTASISDDEVSLAVARGAKGFLLKDARPEELVESIHVIAGGGTVLPSELVDKALVRTSASEARARQIAEVLTAREREVAVLIAEGFSNKHLARKLNVAEGTIKIHLHNIYGKLGVSNRTSLAALVLTHFSHLKSIGRG